MGAVQASETLMQNATNAQQKQGVKQEAATLNDILRQRHIKRRFARTFAAKTKATTPKYVEEADTESCYSIISEERKPNASASKRDDVNGSGSTSRIRQSDFQAHPRGGQTLGGHGAARANDGPDQRALGANGAPR